MKAVNFVRSQIEVALIVERHKLINEEGRWSAERVGFEYQCGYCMEMMYTCPSEGLMLITALKQHWEEKALEVLEDKGYSVEGEMR